MAGNAAGEGGEKSGKVGGASASLGVFDAGHHDEEKSRIARHDRALVRCHDHGRSGVRGWVAASRDHRSRGDGGGGHYQASAGGVGAGVVPDGSEYLRSLQNSTAAAGDICAGAGGDPPAGGAELSSGFPPHGSGRYRVGGNVAQGSGRYLGGGRGHGEGGACDAVYGGVSGGGRGGHAGVWVGVAGDGACGGGAIWAASHSECGGDSEHKRWDHGHSHGCGSGAGTGGVSVGPGAGERYYANADGVCAHGHAAAAGVLFRYEVSGRGRIGCTRIQAESGAAAGAGSTGSICGGDGGIGSLRGNQTTRGVCVCDADGAGVRRRIWDHVSAYILHAGWQRSEMVWEQAD